MPARINQEESAWFYHTPFESSKSDKPTPKPLMSQIPGINGCHDDTASGSTRPYYKDTDTKYVRLAKQGGRRDLLNYQEFDKRTDAVAYPRVNWFYLEDNALEDAKKKKEMNWKFGVPDYMTQNLPRNRESGDQIDELQQLESLKMDVHEKSMASSAQDPHSAKDLPNPSLNQNMATERETEPVSSSKAMKWHDNKNDCSSLNYKIERVKAVVPEPEFKNPITQKESYNSKAAGYHRKQASNEVSMSKLLSHSYAKEWHEQLKDMQTSSKRVPSHAAQERNNQSENNRDQYANRSSERFESISCNNAVSQNLEDPRNAPVDK